MSGIDDKKYLKKTHDKVENPHENTNSKGDYYGMNIATFTFGGKQPNGVQNAHAAMNRHKEKESEHEDLAKKTNFRKTSSSKHFELEGDKERESALEKEKEKTKLLKKVRENTSYNAYNQAIPYNYSPDISPIILNKIGAHNSFLSVIVHSIWHLTNFRNFILSDQHLSINKEGKYRLLYELKHVITKYSQSQSQNQAPSTLTNKTIDITRLRTTLAEVFQNRRKFLIDQPDDPVDCLFAFINAAHSYSMKNSLNEVIDTLCINSTSSTNKCLAHTNFWMDLCKIEECECKGSSKRFFSHHNYMFDIPLDKIFQLCSNINLIEMSKSFKLKTGKFSQVGSTELANIADLKGKLFLYFKMLMNHLKSDCPAKGVRCEINKTTKNLYLNNLPNYLTFCLRRNPTKNPDNIDNQPMNISSGSTSITVTETLKTLILIPKLFDLSTIFDHSSKQKVFFEFFGGICIKPGQTYTCFFKSACSIEHESCIWSHYDDYKVTNFTSWFDLISFLLKNLEFPFILFYQIQEKYSDSEKELTTDELQTLERYARNADNLQNILQNRFRPDEDIINLDYDLNFLNENNENLRHLMKRQKQNSKNSTSISTSKPNSNNNSNSRIEQPTEYICSKCLAKNRIENQICSICNRNNEDVIEDLLKKRGMNNYINIANFNLNINTGNEKDKDQKILLINKSEKEVDMKATSLRKRNYSNSNLISKTNKPTNPFVEPKNIIRTEDFISDDSEDDMDYANKKNYNMPKQIVNKKETPVLIKQANNMVNIASVSNVKNKNETACFSPGSNPTAKNNTLKGDITASFGSKPLGKDKDKDTALLNESNRQSSLHATVTRNSKKTDTNLEKESKNEDRILPYELVKQRSKKSLQISPNNFNMVIDKWLCDYCNSMNKKSELRCQDCNKIQKDSHSENSLNNDHTFNSSFKRNINNDVVNSYKESMKSVIKEEPKPIHSLDRKNTDKKLSSNYTAYNNHNTAEHPTILKKCLCYTNYCVDNIIKNKVCTICNRHVDNINTYENSIKKKYQQELNRHSISSTHNTHNGVSTTNQIVAKRNDSQPKSLKKEDSFHNLNNKFRCPSSNPASSKPKLTTYNRYKDIFIEHPDDINLVNPNNPSNPFSAGNVKIGNRHNLDPGTFNSYKHNLSNNYNSNQSTTQKLQSTSKMKMK